MIRFGAILKKTKSAPFYFFKCKSLKKNSLKKVSEKKKKKLAITSKKTETDVGLFSNRNSKKSLLLFRKTN